MTNLYYLDQIHPHMTVGDLAKEYYPDITYDITLPEPWVAHMQDQYNWDPRGQVVWGYPCETGFGIPLPLTVEAADQLADACWEEHPVWEKIVVPKIKRRHES